MNLHMKWMRGGHNAVAAAKVAFALMAPAVACAPSPRAPVSEVCVSPDAAVGEARHAVEGAIARISELYGNLAARLGKMGADASGSAQNARVVRAVMETNVAFAEFAADGMRDNLEALRYGLSGTGDDAGRMRRLAQRACVLLESAEVTFESTMDILDRASADIAASGKE